MRTGFTLLLALICAILGLLIWNHQSGSTLGLANDDFAEVAYLGLIGAVIAAGLVGSQRSIGSMLSNMLIWLMIILGLSTVYVYRDEVETIASTVASQLTPGRPTVVKQGDTLAVSIAKSRGGHFEAVGQVNGVEIDFLIDTGATLIALSYDDAIAAGFRPEDMSFTQVINTANGRAMAAPIRLDQVQIGPLIRSNLRATVAEPGKLGQSLLGMNFISSLSSFEMQRDEVILRD